MLKIQEKPLFIDEKIDVVKQENYLPKKNTFPDIKMSMGNDPVKLKDEGMMVLRILGNRFSKKTMEDERSFAANLSILKDEIHVKKGVFPQNLSVMNTLFRCFLKK